jgi:hypothetical protein
VRLTSKYHGPLPFLSHSRPRLKLKLEAAMVDMYGTMVGYAGIYVRHLLSKYLRYTKVHLPRYHSS